MNVLPFINSKDKTQNKNATPSEHEIGNRFRCAQNINARGIQDKYQQARNEIKKQIKQEEFPSCLLLVHRSYPSLTERSCPHAIILNLISVAIFPAANPIHPPSPLLITSSSSQNPIPAIYCIPSIIIEIMIGINTAILLGYS